MEKLILMALFDYFRRNLLISVLQSGFIPGHSTVTHLVEMYHNVCQAVSIFYDVSRAFNRVWHRGLIFKLENVAFLDPC